MSLAIARTILRKFSASRSTLVENAILPIFVTPSTSTATSRPNLASISAIEVPVSSGTSWSRPAMIVVTSMRIFARMPATSRGCERYGSPEVRSWPRWATAE